MDYDGNGDINYNWCAWNRPQRNKGISRVGNLRMNRDLSNYNIVKIVQNTEKSSGDLKRLAVTQNSVKDHQLILT